jgi:AcrR family transcriptional regulator
MFAGTLHAHAAGVSKGGLLCHFASKYGLLAGMVGRRIDRPGVRCAADQRGRIVTVFPKLADEARVATTYAEDFE